MRSSNVTTVAPQNFRPCTWNQNPKGTKKFGCYIKIKCKMNKRRKRLSKVTLDLIKARME